MLRFVFEMNIDRSNLCNLINEKNIIQKNIAAGRRMVVYGRRNTGKTSLLKNIIIPDFLNNKKKRLALFVDFMGVVDYEEIGFRMQKSFSAALSKSFPTESYLQTLIKILKGMRPTITTDPLTGQTQFSLEISKKEDRFGVDVVLKNLADIHEEYETLIVFDEFQDIANIKGAEAKLRGALQFLPADFPIVFSGSKKHILSKIFTAPNAPFAGWGIDIEIPTISKEEYQAEYQRYVNERFAFVDLRISLENIKFLLNLVQGIPESANIVCDIIQNTMEKKEVTKEDVTKAVVLAVEERRGRFEEKLVRFREGEKEVLTAIAKHGPIKKIKGKDFLKSLKNLSPTAIYSLTKKLEDQSEIFLTPEGYVVSDPLLAEFFIRYR